MMEYGFLKAISEATKCYKNFPLPVIITDNGFHVYWSNGHAKQLFAQFADSVGFRLALDEFGVQNLMEEMQDKGTCTIHDIIPMSGIMVSMIPIYADGMIIGVIHIFMDGEAVPNTQSFYRSATTSLAISGGLQTVVSEIFDLMDAASLKSDILDQGWVKGSFAKIGQYCYQILRTASNIRVYSQILAGALELHPQLVDLCTVLEEWREPVQRLGEGLGIPVQFHIPAAVLAVRLNLKYFESIFFNLLHNAFYYTRKGNELEIKAYKRKGKVVLAVTDRGLGIPKQATPLIFRPYQSYNHQKERPTIGLGLTLCKALVEAHGGGIQVRSVEGKGTTAVVQFPESAGFSTVCLAQGTDRYTLADRFSSLYIGLWDARLSPHRNYVDGNL